MIRPLFKGLCLAALGCPVRVEDECWSVDGTGGRLAMLYVNQPIRVGRWLSFEVNQPVQSDDRKDLARTLRDTMLERFTPVA